MQAILLPHLSSAFGFQPLLLNIPTLNRMKWPAMDPCSFCKFLLVTLLSSYSRSIHEEDPALATKMMAAPWESVEVS